MSQPLKLRPVKYASVFAQDDKWIVKAGPIHVGTYRDYCIAAEECEAWNRKRDGKPAMQLHRQQTSKGDFSYRRDGKLVA